MSRRTQRVASTIQQELAMIILRELNDPRLTGMPSITRVKVSPDLSVADVYVTIMGTDAQQNTALNALRHSAGLMRSRLTKSLSIRQSPFLKFHIDENLKKEIAVLDLLRKVADETAEADRRRAEREAAESGSATEAAADASVDATPSATTPSATTPDATTAAEQPAMGEGQGQPGPLNDHVSNEELHEEPGEE